MSTGDTSARSSSADRGRVRFDTGDGMVEIAPDDVVNKIRKYEQDVEADGAELPDLELPGFGPLRDSCGDPFFKYCADCGATTEVGQTCERSRCSRCAAAWARVRSTKHAAKLEQTRRDLNGEQGYGRQKFHHVVLSPPDGTQFNADDEDEALEKGFETCKELLDALGAGTGYLYYHHSRGKDGDDRDKWKNRIFSNREWSDVREELEHSPHFHAFVVANFVPGGELTNAIEDQTGWVIERITKEDSNVSIYDEYDLCSGTSYAISHCGIGEDRAAYRAFGRTHNTTPEDYVERQIDAAMRTVAPTTLGISYADLACQEDVAEPDDQDVDDENGPSEAVRETHKKLSRQERVADPASNQINDWGASSGPFGTTKDLPTAPNTPGSPDGSATTIDAEDLADAEADDQDVDDEPEPCKGRLLPITDAPAHLGDPEWVRQAAHVDDLRQTWREWRVMQDGEPPPE